MKTFLLTFLVLLFAVEAQAVEVLVQAKDFWQKGESVDDTLTTSADTTAWFREMLRQTHKGDIIIVKPNGHIWGNREKPPGFVIIKIPDATMAQADKYMEGLIDPLADPSSDTAVILQRRWHFLRKVVDSALVLWPVIIELTNTQAQNVVKKYTKQGIKNWWANRTRQRD